MYLAQVHGKAAAHPNTEPDEIVYPPPADRCRWRCGSGYVVGALLRGCDVVISNHRMESPRSRPDWPSQPKAVPFSGEPPSFSGPTLGESQAAPFPTPA